MNIIVLALVGYLAQPANIDSSQDSDTKVITCRGDTVQWNAYWRSKIIEEADTSDWNSYIDSARQIRFRYPPYIEVDSTHMDYDRDVYTISFQFADTAENRKPVVIDAEKPALLVSFVRMDFLTAAKDAPSFLNFFNVHDTSVTSARIRRFLPAKAIWWTDAGQGGYVCPDEFVGSNWKALYADVPIKRFNDNPKAEEPASWLGFEIHCFAMVGRASGYSVALSLNSEKVNKNDFFMCVKSVKDLR